MTPRSPIHASDLATDLRRSIALDDAVKALEPGDWVKLTDGRVVVVDWPWGNSGDIISVLIANEQTASIHASDIIEVRTGRGPPDTDKVILR